MRILIVDVGGSHAKVLATGQRTPIKIPSGPDVMQAWGSCIAGYRLWNAHVRH